MSALGVSTGIAPLCPAGHLPHREIGTPYRRRLLRPAARAETPAVLGAPCPSLFTTLTSSDGDRSDGDWVDLPPLWGRCLAGQRGNVTRIGDPS